MTSPQTIGSVSLASAGRLEIPSSEFKLDLPISYSSSQGEPDDILGECQFGLSDLGVTLRVPTVSRKECASSCKQNSSLFNLQGISCQHSGTSFFSRTSRSNTHCRIFSGKNLENLLNPRLTRPACISACQTIVDESDIEQNIKCTHNSPIFERVNGFNEEYGGCEITGVLNKKEFSLSIATASTQQCDLACETLQQTYNLDEVLACDFTPLTTQFVTDPSLTP